MWSSTSVSSAMSDSSADDSLDVTGDVDVDFDLLLSVRNLGLEAYGFISSNSCQESPCRSNHGSTSSFSSCSDSDDDDYDNDDDLLLSIRNLELEAYGFISSSSCQESPCHSNHGSTSSFSSCSESDDDYEEEQEEEQEEEVTSNTQFNISASHTLIIAGDDLLSSMNSDLEGYMGSESEEEVTSDTQFNRRFFNFFFEDNGRWDEPECSESEEEVTSDTQFNRRLDEPECSPSQLTAEEYIREYLDDLNSSRNSRIESYELDHFAGRMANGSPFYGGPSMSDSVNQLNRRSDHLSSPAMVDPGNGRL